MSYKKTVKPAARANSEISIINRQARAQQFLEHSKTRT